MTNAKAQQEFNLMHQAAVTRECSSPEPERHGFTMIEILIAITVLGALAAIAIPQFANYRRAAQNAQAILDIRKVDLAIQVYRRQNNSWPTTLADLGLSINNDPWNKSYKYLKIEGASPSEKAKARKDHFLVPLNTDFDLYSSGADGMSDPPLTADVSQDDVLRADSGRFVGLGSAY